jgi:hypothetical protein
VRDADEVKADSSCSELEDQVGKLTAVVITAAVRGASQAQAVDIDGGRGEGVAGAPLSSCESRADHRGTTAEAPPTASSQARVENKVKFRIKKTKRKKAERLDHPAVVATIDKVIDKARKHRDTGNLAYRDAVSFHQEVQKLL